MRLSLVSLLLILYTCFTYAAPPVIWFGNDAKFLNSGTIIVPGLGLGVVHSSSTGVFSVGPVLPSEVVGGTANRFAYFNSSGALASLNNWITNTFGGADVSQAPSLTDPGSPGSAVLNNRSITITTTNDLTNTVVYGYLDQINLDSTNDYSGFEGHEFFIQQTAINDITSDMVGVFNRIQYGVGGVGSTSQNTVGTKSQIRLSGAHVANNVSGTNSQVLMDGGTTANDISILTGDSYSGGTSVNAFGLNLNIQSAGSVTGSMYGANLSMFVNGGAIAQNAVGVNQSFQGDIVNDYTGINSTFGGDIGGNVNAINIYHQGIVTGSFTGYNQTRDGATTGSFLGLNSFLNSSSPVTGDYRGAAFTNDATVGAFASGVFVGQNGVVTKGWTGYGAYSSTDIGDGTGTNATILDSLVNNGTIDGNINIVNNASNATVTGQYNGVALTSNMTSHAGGTGLSWNNSAEFTATNSSIFLATLNNTAEGYRLGGITVNNNQDMTEESRGFYYNDSGDARTKTGLDVFMSGNATDDVQGLRIDMTGQTSTNQRPQSITVGGGTISVQSQYSVAAGAGFDIGNNITATATYPSAITGTASIVQLMQSNTLVQDNFALDPFGLGLVDYGFVSQIDVTSGKTVDLMRGMILGTTTPSGSGGTITEYHALGIIMLPSFGGSVTNPTRMAITDEVLFGQQICDGATDCWFLYNQDTDSENHLFRLALGTSNKKVGTNDKITAHDGHISITQTTSPTTSVNANAGTSATCTVSGSDQSFTLELVTGSAAWAAGEQCQVTFDKAFAAAPHCVFSAINNNGALVSTNAYMPDATTTTASIEFVNADTAATTYKWGVHCL